MMGRWKKPFLLCMKHFLLQYSLTFINVHGNRDTLSHPIFKYLWSTAGCCWCLLTAAGVRMKQLWSGDVETVNWRSGDGSLIHWSQLCSSSPRCNDINKTINKSYQQQRAVLYFLVTRKTQQ